MSKIAFVIPWYGANIPGGSESACRNLAERITKAGINVEVLTTCVKQFSSDWNKNYYPEGIEYINDVTVRRFKIRKRNVQKFDQINYKLINGNNVTIEEEEIFLEEMINSTDLELFIKQNKENYKAFLFLPYMFGTTYYGIKSVQEKAILIPAFHDESYAYFNRFKEAYSKVKAMIFFSQAEKDWANKVYDLRFVKQNVLGLGIEPFSFSADRFKEKFKISFPFILYAGRKDQGKNVHTLIEFFRRYHKHQNTDLRLVLIGGGQLDIPKDIENFVIDLGFVDEQDKYDAYAAAQVFCNPSPNESFSIVIMESWRTGRPVLVNEFCEVTKRFCEDSNGGLYFSNYDEFSECIKILSSNIKVADQLGQNGRSYVETKFEWPTVTNNYINFINECFEEK